MLAITEFRLYQIKYVSLLRPVGAGFNCIRKKKERKNEKKEDRKKERRKKRKKEKKKKEKRKKERKKQKKERKKERKEGRMKEGNNKLHSYIGCIHSVLIVVIVRFQRLVEW